MEYKGLEQIRNKYPVDVTNEDINDSYQKDGNSIIYTGLYPENFISFEMLSLDDIKLGDLKHTILSIPIAKKIIDAQPFGVRW